MTFSLGENGGKGIRTPDFQLAKLALYQLSYAPCEISILVCGSRIANLGGGACDLAICDLGEAEAGWRSDDRHPGFVRFSAKLCSRAMKSGPVSLCYFPLTGTAKYAVLWCSVWQRFELSDAIFPGPHESMHNVAFDKRRVASKPDDIASLIDRRRRIPPRG